MPKLLVLYPPPTDAATFERRYRDEHGPLVHKNMKGMKRFVASRVMGRADGGQAPYARVAELYFDSMDDLNAAASSEGGKQTVAHAVEISTGGPPIILVAEDD
ncbi:MAG TPA: EthD family reductase [Gemmatimonadaceae bacterium]|nr:EthD family reductase [Gemmatimonadaceae bacterium]